MKNTSILRKLCILLIAVLSILNHLSAQSYIQLGSGTSTTSVGSVSPVGIYYRSTHMQIVYTKAELNAAGVHSGVIADLGFYIHSVPDHNLPNYTVKLGHTTAIDGSSTISVPFTQVYNNALYAPVAGGYDMLNLDTIFYWNGIDNLVVDVCWDRVPSYTSSGSVRYYTDGSNVGFTRSDGADQCGVNTSSTITNKPQVQFEFGGQGTDNAAVLSTSATGIVCGGSIPVTATIANYGENVIDSVQIGWSVNAILQTPVWYKTALDTFGGSGSNSATVTLGNYNFIDGVSYAVKVFTYNPNNNSDSDASNDTVATNPTVGLGGTYTLGSGASDYGSFTAALTDLHSKGICGDVVFEVASGTYFEQIEVNNIPGTSANATVTFTSASADSTSVTLSHAASYADNYTLKIDGASWLRFENMTIESTSDSYDRAVLIENGTNLEFNNNIIANNAVNTPYGYNLIEATGTVQVLHFNNNVLFQGYRAYYSGTSNADTVVFKGNHLLEQYDGGITFNYGDYFTAEDNVIYTQSTAAFDAFYLYDADEGIYIERNNIKNIRGGYGIYIYSASLNNDRGRIANNFIHLNFSSTSAEGIYISLSNNIDVVYNTVNISSTNTDNVALALFSNGGHVVQNNNFATNGGKAFQFGNASSYLTSADYNNYFTTGSLIGVDNGNNYASLSAYQSASGFETNSLSVNPYFLNDTSYESAQVALNNSGVAFGGISLDIEGETRDASNPDIGADEFTPTGVDAGIYEIIVPEIPYAQGNHDVKAVIRNFGGTTLTSATIEWEVNGVAQSSVAFTGSLATGEVDTVTLTSFNFQEKTFYTFKANTTAPNVGADAAVVNDTAYQGATTPGLNGNYTIGGATPDFADFNAAAANINLGGVVGNTTFNVRSGTYNERFALTQIPKLNSANHITFQSETGDSTAVTLATGYVSSNLNYIIQLNGTKGISFKDLTIQNTSSNSYARVIQLDSGAAYIDFIRCGIYAGTTTSSYTSAIYAYNLQGNQTDISNLTVDSCIVKNGYYGVYIDGRSGDEHNFSFTNSKFIGAYYYSLYFDNIDSVTVSNNIITPRSAAHSNYYSIYANYLDHGSITSNQIYAPTKNQGVYLYYNEGSAAQPFIVANNFISVGGSSSSGFAFQMYGANYIKVVHNNMLSQNSHNTSRVFQDVYGYHNGNNAVEVLNNVFQHDGVGYAVYFNSNSTATSANYNNLFSNGSNLGYYNGSTANDLTNWQSLSSLDANSISIDAQFENDTNLHVNAGGLNEAATPLAYITTDIDGDTRDAMPDIGADEFTPPADDAGLLAFTGPLVPFNPGSQNVYVKLLNNGSDTLRTVTIEWSVNGTAQASYNWSGTLSPGSVIDSVNIGSYTFPADSVHSLMANTTLPNGNTDALFTNDTISATNVFAGMSGIYTIGGTMPDFSTFTEATQALHIRGVVGWVTFDVRDGVYNESVLIRDIRGASASDSITFRSASGSASAVTLQTTVSNQHIIELRGADYISFKDLTIFNAYRYGGSPAVVLDSMANNINLLGCVLKDSLETSYGVYLLQSSNGYSDNNLLVKDCAFINGRYGVYIDNGSSNHDVGIQIINSTFTDQYYYGIYMDYCDEYSISGNTITSNRGYSSFYAMYLNNGNSSAAVTGNYLYNINGYGIYYNHYASSGNEALVANNFIHLTGTQSRYAIQLYYGNYVNVAHNSISIYNTNTSTRALEEYYAQNSNILNNIFYNNEGGVTLDLDNYNGSVVSNYNNLFSNGTNVAGYRNTAYIDLASFAAAATADTNSISIDPQFVDTLNLHAEAVGLDGAGTPLAYVTKDYDGEGRDPSTPDIGADEFYVNTNDASLTAVSGPTMPFADGLQTVYVSLLNNGADTLQTLNIDWEVDGVLQTTLNWTGALSSGETLDSVALGTFTFVADNFYDIKAYASLPNGQPDILNTNDTVEVTDLHPALSGLYTIGGTTPDYPDFTSAISALNAGGVLGWVTFNVRDGVYNEQIELTEVLGASATDSIVFQSENGDASLVSLEHNGSSGSPYTVWYNGADFIGFKNITLAGTNASYARVVELDNSVQNARFVNCVFEMNTGTNANLKGISGSSAAPLNLQVTACTFNGGYSGIELNGNQNSGTSIKNNSFNGQYYYGLYLVSFEAPVVQGNQVLSYSGSSTSFSGIYLSDIDDDFIISKNTVHVPYSGYAYYLYNLDGTATYRGLFANNLGTVGDSTSSTNSRYAFRMSYGSYVDVVYNSSYYSLQNGQAWYNQGNPFSVNFKNNIMYADNGAYALYTTGAVSGQDHNNYFSTGTDLIYNSNTATAYTDLSSWQSASAEDANSISADPMFTSSVDLHVTQSALDSAGTHIAAVTDDIDGDLRDATHPDIGADEVSFFYGDLAVNSIVSPVSGCALGAAEQVTVALYNNSSGQYNNFVVSLVVDGDTTHETISTALGGGASRNYTFATTFDFSSVGTYNIKSWVSLTGDINNANDTTTQILTVYTPPTVVLNNDTTICEGEIVQLTASGGVSYSWSNGLSGSSITVAPNDSTKYTVTVTDANGCSSQDSVWVYVNDSRDTVYVTETTCDPNLAGSFTNTYINQYGCDSVVYTTVNLLPSYNDSLVDILICEGESTLIFGNTENATGYYYDTLTASNGCDSVLVQQLIVQAVDTVALVDVYICEGESTTIFGNTENAAGIYYNTITASTGCDSVLTQQLFINPVDTVYNGDLFVCDGESIMIFGTNQSTAGDYYNTLTASTGCDSVVFHTLYVNPVYDTIVDVSICEGDSILLDGIYRTVAGKYNEVLTTIAGCDSLVETNLMIDPVDTVYDSYQVAIGDSVLVGGAYQTTSGTYTDVLTAATGCDSVVITTLDFVPPARYFTYTGNINYQNAVVYPLVGDGYTTFQFEVTYYDTNGILPPYGFPRTILDYEGNGSFNNNNDRTIVMTEADPGDMDPTDGKVYTASINSLIVGQNYEVLIQVIENNQQYVFGPFDYPDVLAEPDLEIFANNITFSNPNPPVSSPLTVSATINNTSDYDAQNFVVHLRNQYDTTIVYPDITVANLTARNSTTVSWNITTPAQDAWCPMEVSVDYTNVITESNELDNVAIRPFTNGDYNIPGAIHVYPNVSPSSFCSQPNKFVRVYGYAYYSGTAVPLQDSSVAGSEVTITRGGATYTGLTNSRGYFSISIPAPTAPAHYPVNVEVTDFTLTGDSTTTFEVKSCPCSLPDLAAYLTLSDYSIVAGESIDGTGRISNVGCDTAIAHIMTFTQTGGAPVLVNQNVPVLAPGEFFEYNFSNIVFNVPGTYYMCVYADTARTVGEINFSNNTYCRTIRVYPALPDIAPTAGPYGSQYLCNATNPNFKISNLGAVGTGAFDCQVIVKQNGLEVDTFYHNFTNIDAFSYQWFSIPYLPPVTGTYTYDVYADTVTATGGIVVETNENNNTASYTHTIIECKPDLVISGCNNLQVDPYGRFNPGDAVIFEATVRNSGNAVAPASTVRFQVGGGGATYDVAIGALNPGQSLTVQTNAVFVASATTTLTVTADVLNVVNNEFSETNNSITDNLCWEFEPVPSCGTDFWERTYNVNETAYLFVAVDVDHLYKADSLYVQFEVSGPGVPGTQNLGKALMTNVTKNCWCPRSASLPTNFVFNQAGTYTFTMTVDPDNEYIECDESNNVLVRQVTVLNRPDMRILSQHINPDVLHPDLGDSIQLTITYENIGKSNVNDVMELKVRFNNTDHDSIYPVVGLVSGDNTSYTIPTKWTTTIPGAHIVRAYIDSDDQITENDELNNEATRAIIFGEAANLYWVNFETDNDTPSNTDTISIFGYVKNNGDIACAGDADISYINDNLDTIYIGTVALGTIQPGDSVLVEQAWLAIDTTTTLVGEIVNTTELEFTYNDNMATTQIGKFNVNLITTSACYGDTGSIKAVVTGTGVAPYSYSWNTGENTDSISKPTGTYTVSVSDATGFTVSATGTISATGGGLQQLPDVLICKGDSAEILGVWRDLSGVYYDTLVGTGGCDSIVRQTLIVDSARVISTTNTYLCSGDSVEVFGTYTTMQGMYFDTVPSEIGCGNIYQHNVWVLPSYNDTLVAVTGCDSAEVFGSYVFQSGWYTDTLQTLDACDSIVSVYANIYESDTTQVFETACNEFVWTENGSTYDDGGIYYVNLQNQHGCDSIIELNLTVYYTDTVMDTVTACDSYTWDADGMMYTVSGDYTATLNNIHGCDSVVMLNLTINQSSDTTYLSATSCNDYRWYPPGVNNGGIGSTNSPDGLIAYDTSGIYYATLENQIGCDSVLVLDLTINYSDTTTEMVTSCDTYVWPATGLTYNDNGTYTVSLTNTSGCDSVVTLDLNLIFSDTIADTIVACDSYTWPANGMTYNSSGDYVANFTNVDGCDSIHMLNLVINQSSTGSETITACDSYTWPTNGMMYTSSGSYNDTLTNAVGCDSVVTLNLTINYSDTTTEMVTSCDTYVWPATGLTYNDNGTYTVILTNVSGCDSVVTLDLNLIFSDTIADTIVACDSYTWAANGMTYTSSGDYVANFTNTDGCDSIHMLNLVINQSTTGSETITACDSYTWPTNGMMYTSSGSYNDTLTNAVGCDSVVTLNLTINYSDTTTEMVTSCDTYVWPATGLTYNDNGTYTVTLTNVSGCDSVVTLDLNLIFSDTIADTIVACDSYTWAENGMTYTSSGDYVANFTNADGCDSIHMLNLVINQSSASSETITACDSYTWPTNGIMYTSSGSYNDTLTNAVGCDSVVTLNLTIDTINTAVTVSGFTLNAVNNSTSASFQWLYCDSAFAPVPGATGFSFTPTVDGNYAVAITENGCTDTSSCYLITGIGLAEADFGAGFTLFPNPTSGRFTIAMDKYYNEVTIVVREISGKTIAQYKVGTVNRFTAEIEGAKGIYLVEVHTGKQLAAFKVVKD